MCSFKYRKNNNKVYETKIKYKDRHVLMHTCCCILIFVSSGFDQTEKGFKILFKNGFGKLRKEKGKDFSPPLSLSYRPT